MTQLDIYSMMNGDDRNPASALNRNVTETYARLGIGSILNAPFPGPIDGGRTGWSASEWTTILDQIRAIYREHSKTPMVYGIDTIHGATYVRGATLFGQPLSAAASFNLDLVYKMGEIEAKDTLAAGIPWVFSPVLGIAVQPKWSRVYETFGEDPFLASQMGAAIIRGIQSTGKVAACMKHFIGYSNVIDGLDRADNVISDWDLVNYFAPSFIAATRAGVKTAMETYVSVNGEPVIASHKLLTQLLRDDMNFTGMLVSDYSEIDRLFSEHHSVPSVDAAVRVVLSETSLDMNMGPNFDDFAATVERLVGSGQLEQARLDASVRRILELKRDLGLFTAHGKGPSETNLPPDDPVGSKDDQAVALDLARESIVLLENRDSTLPLKKNARVFLTGPLSNNKGLMCGGWSVFWSGSSNSSHFPNGKTLKEALETSVQSLDHLEVVDVEGKFDENEFDKALDTASRSDYTIVALGEGNYAEKGGDITDLALPTGQRAYLEALIRLKTTKVIVVLIAGRPRTLLNAHDGAHAVLSSFLPCEQGGQALTDVLLGDITPSGKLPITYPKDSGNAMPYFHRVNTVCDNWKECEVQWPFGYGLSYTRFEYSDLTLSPSYLHPDEQLHVQITVTNTGPVAGSESVLLFLTQKYRLASVPEAKMLKQFQKIHLKPGEAMQVKFTLGLEDWGYYQPQIGHGLKREVEVGEYIVSFQASIPRQTLAPTATKPTSDMVTTERDRGGHATVRAVGREEGRHFESIAHSFFLID
jgi:beta-glucosidase